MEVWVVIYDNGEYYDDYEEWIEAVMSTEDKAKNYLPKGLTVGQFNRIEKYILDEPSNWQSVL